MHERHRLLQAYGWAGSPVLTVPPDDEPHGEPLPTTEREKAPH